MGDNGRPYVRARSTLVSSFLWEKLLKHDWMGRPERNIILTQVLFAFPMGLFLFLWPLYSSISSAWPIKAKWHVEHPWVMRRKCLEHLCHITKMATTLIWWKPFKTVFLLANKKSQWAWFWNVEIKLWAYHCSFKWWPLIGLLSISRRKCVSILQHRDTLKTCHTRWYCH